MAQHRNFNVPRSAPVKPQGLEAQRIGVSVDQARGIVHVGMELRDGRTVDLPIDLKSAQEVARVLVKQTIAVGAPPPDWYREDGTPRLILPN